MYFEIRSFPVKLVLENKEYSETKQNRTMYPNIAIGTGK